MRITMRAVTHQAKWYTSTWLVTNCGCGIYIPGAAFIGTSWSCSASEETATIVDYDTLVDCMTCLVLEAQGG
jgi:hypothetical protein